MPKWTSEIEEIRKLSELPGFIEKYGLKNCRVFLAESATPIEGRVLPARVGNNAGAGGRWKHYGSIAIRLENEDVEVDFLDVVRAEVI